jgi:hypothetical protein
VGLISGRGPINSSRHLAIPPPPHFSTWKIGCSDFNNLIRATHLWLPNLILRQIHAQKVIDKNVMEKCTFSSFTHVHQIGQIGFRITFCVWIFLQLFNRSVIRIKFSDILFDLKKNFGVLFAL